MNIIIRWLVGLPSTHTIERPTHYPYTFSTGLARGDITLYLIGVAVDAQGNEGQWTVAEHNRGHCAADQERETEMTVTAKMVQIRANDGATISVEPGTDAATIAILEAASAVTFWEFHYTGNSPNGNNNGNYEDMEAWFLAAGLVVKDDDLSILLYNMEPITGVASLRHRGKTLRYHAQAHRSTRSQFGPTTRVSYRLIECR